MQISFLCVCDLIMLRDSIVVNPLSIANEISLKSRYTFNRLHGVTSQKLVLFKPIVVSVSRLGAGIDAATGCTTEGSEFEFR
jgi:hypothetical protein